MPELTTLSGWGGTAPSAAQVLHLSSDAALRQVLDSTTGPLIARGLGRSYGDPAQCAGGMVVDGTSFTGIDLDLSTGVVAVGAGTSLDALMAAAVPHGWFVPVTPGTRQVTIGGAMAADIHGKNHHVDSSFMAHVLDFTLTTAEATVVVSPQSDPALFWATAGGMGLTGVITSARLALMPIESTYVLVDTERCNSLDEVMAAMVEGDHRYRYSVAWVDCMTTGARLGRGVLTRGDHAPLDALSPRQQRTATSMPEGSRLSIPWRPPSGLLNRASITAFNEAWFRRFPVHQVGHPEHFASFFHPLDGVAHWNRLYGPKGFVQYQFCVDDAHGDVVRTVIERLSSSRLASFLAVLKRFGPGTAGPLSFPVAGWTLALDLPVGPAHLSSTLDELDQLVADAGGRVYLAKDARLRPELVPVMYPRLADFRRVKARVDPKGRFTSDQARRLMLTEEPS